MMAIAVFGFWFFVFVVDDVEFRSFFPPRWDRWQTISFLLATSILL